MSGLERGSVVTTSRLDELWRNALPFLSVLVLLAIDLAPLPSAAPTTIAPLCCLCGIFFWTVHRPDLLGNGLLFLLTLLLDATAGTPPGLTVLALFVTRLALVAPPRFFAGRSFVVLWACFSVAVVLLLGAAFTVTAVVRLSLHARRDEIDIMQLVGAPMGYIRGPFVSEDHIEAEKLLMRAVASLALSPLLPVLPKPTHAQSRG